MQFCVHVRTLVRRRNVEEKRYTEMRPKVMNNRLLSDMYKREGWLIDRAGNRRENEQGKQSNMSKRLNVNSDAMSFIIVFAIQIDSNVDGTASGR